MLRASMLALQAAPADQAYRVPSYFLWVALLLLAGGALAWLVAAVLGFTRARVFGASARWFALSAACLVVYHLQWLVLAVGLPGGGADFVLSFGAFFNLFVFLAAICSIIGFTRLTNPGP